jgi:hypothetical protein
VLYVHLPAEELVQFEIIRTGHVSALAALHRHPSATTPRRPCASPSTATLTGKPAQRTRPAS